jgi:hypothetical protein
MTDQILPSEGGTLPNDALAIVTDDDVMAILPAYMRESDNAPIRDAIVAALRVMATTYEEAASYAAAQRDVIYASGDELDSLLEPRRYDGELDEDYRLRALGLRDVVTPNAICAAVNVLIAPYTCSYLEPELDQFFVTGSVDDGSDTVWGCFLDVAPQYQDRFYPDDTASNSGAVKAHVNPGPAGLYDHDGGRYFVIQIPDLSNLNKNIVLVYNGVKMTSTDPSVPELGGQFKFGESIGGTGIYPMGVVVTTPANRSFLFNNTTGEDSRYDAIIDVVERLRGGGFQWALVVHPS